MRHVELRRARDGQWYYVVVAANGQVTETSETYTRRSNAKRAARKSFPDLEVRT